MKYILTAGALLLGSTLAHAQSSTWTFSYIGFYDREAAAFLPDAQISGSFSGSDLDSNGLLERNELSSFFIGTKDYVACAGSSNATYHCGADSFVFSPQSGLSFSLGEYGGDPEGMVGGGYLIESGKLSYEYQFNPYGGFEHHLDWTGGTQLLMVSSAAMVTAVPESREWAMLVAGLGAICLWRRRQASTRIEVPA